MATKKYFYNPQTCTYEPAKTRKADVIIGFLSFAVVSVLFAIVLTVVFNKYYDTPTEAKLKKDNRELSTNLSQLTSGLSEVNQMMVDLRNRDAIISEGIFETKSTPASPIGEGILPAVDENIYKKGFNDQKVVDEFYRQIEELKENSNKSNTNLTNIASFAVEHLEALKYIPTIQPIDNPEQTALASGFGKRMNPYHHGMMDHNGVDFTAPVGTPVWSTAEGKVIKVIMTDVKSGMGNRVEIDHGNGIITRYGHLNDINVKEGQLVKQQTQIGTIGTSGGTIAPSVHYEVVKNGKKVNPINYFIKGLTENEYLAILELAMRENQSLD